MAQYYNITVIQDEVSKIVTDLIWSKKQMREKRTVLSGCYVIETTHKEYDAVETWKLYMTLINVEGAFRSLK